MVHPSQSPDSYSPSSPDGPPAGQRVSHEIVFPSKRVDTSSTIQAAVAVPPCRCQCGQCNCSSCIFRANLFVNDQNSETYAGQGTAMHIDGHHASTFLKIENVSLDAHESGRVIVAPPSFEMISKINEHPPADLAEQRTEQYLDDIDNAPWNYFLSGNSMTSDAIETSGMFFGPIDLEGSMENHPLSNDTRSMLSSYMSAMSVRSDAASAVVKHAGSGLENAMSLKGAPRHSFIPLL